MRESDRAPTLCTLGALELTGTTFSRPKPLLVLAYVALEGRQPRRHLAELFFAGAEHPLQSLSVALSRLRSVLDERLAGDERTVAADVRVDASGLLEALERGDLARADALYRGPFLEGVEIAGLGVEVEEWVYATREFLAAQLREARLRRAEWEAAAARFGEAANWAEAAWSTAGAPEGEADQIVRLHDVLLAGERPVLAARLAHEVRAWGGSVTDDAEALRRRFRAGGTERHASLPMAAPGFIGRERERAAISTDLLARDARLVTLVGPGGVGKTRLALQVAHDLQAAGAFADGVHVVELEDVHDASRVAGRVAHALDVALTGQEAPEARLARALRDRRMLVVLDDAERVGSGVADLVAAMAAAPDVRWLVTSRERLQLRDERTHALAGLGLPPAGARAPHVLRASDAVALFLQRLRRVHGEVPDEDLEKVVRVCRAVGGWPLALEIAASLSRVMALDALGEELARRLDILVESDRDVPVRHHSVLGVLEATWLRLSDGERETLRRLSVFRGGFGRTDAEAVTGAGVARLARLADRALLRQTQAGRFDLHPLVWRFACDRLHEHPDAVAMARAHARHFLALLADHADALGGVERDAVAGRLADDHANIGEAWLSAVRSGDDEAWGAAALALGRYVEAANRYREGAEWLAEARSRARVTVTDDGVQACLALYQGAMLAHLARFDEASAALAPAVAAHDAAIRAAAHETLAHGVELWRGRYAAAGRHLREAAAIYQDLGDVAGDARCTFVLANIAWIAGDWAEALDLLRDARTAFRGLADPHGDVLTTAGIGVVEMDRGNLTEARRLLERAALRAAGMSSLHLRTIVAVNLAHVRLLQGDLDGLEDELAGDLDALGVLGDDPWVAETAAYAARAAALQGRPAEAARYLRTGLEAALRIAHVPSLAEILLATGVVVAAVARDDAVTLLELVRDHPEVYANTRQESVAALAALGVAGQVAIGAATDTLVHPTAHAPAGRVGAPAAALSAAAATLLHDGLLPSGRAFALDSPR
jgi:predicted ATPase